MIVIGFQAVVASLAPSAQAGGAAAPPNWQWEIDEGACTLHQQAGGSGLAYSLSRTPTGARTTLILSVPGLRPRSFEDLRFAELQFEGGVRIPVEGFVGPDRRGKEIVLDVERQTMEWISRSPRFSLASRGVGTIALAPQNMTEATEALTSCGDRLLASWGIDVTAWHALSRPPEPAAQPASWLLPSDYPDREKAYAKPQTVVARLTVGIDGKVADCAALNSGPAEEFKAAACAIFKKRGRFRPALDAKGSPVEAPYILRLTFAPVII